MLKAVSTATSAPAQNCCSGTKLSPNRSSVCEMSYAHMVDDYWHIVYFVLGYNYFWPCIGMYDVVVEK
jgi:hypothetical protein